MDTTTKLIPDPTTDAPVFYTLPAVSLEEGMSTADGQDVLDVGEIDLGVIAHVYTPADDEAQDEQRRGAPEARVYKLTDTADMADFVNTTTPGRVHPDALVKLTLAPGELRPGDLVTLDESMSPDGQARQYPMGTVTEREGSDPDFGRSYVVDLVGGGQLHTNEHARRRVLRPSGVIEEVVVSELEEGDFYRNLGDPVFLDVESITEGDLPTEFDDPDELTIESSNGNQAVYDSSAVVERWRPSEGEEQARG